MKILIYGAGVLGSLYAARLHTAGQDVSILARGERLAQLQERGIVLEDPSTGKHRSTIPHVVDSLRPDDSYDLVMVLVRKNQLSDVLPALAQASRVPAILFMVNGVAGFQEIASRLGCERVLLGFAGAGGTRQGHIVSARILPRMLQPTSIAELDGRDTPRVKEIAQILREAGFPTVVQRNMDAWLKTHAALVSPIANSIYMAGGDIHRLARDRQAVQLMYRAIQEGFRVLHSLRIPITPPRIRLLEWLPAPLIIAVLQRLLDTDYAELIVARHANAARDEMRQIAQEFHTLAEASQIPVPSIEALRGFI